MPFTRPLIFNRFFICLTVFFYQPNGRYLRLLSTANPVKDAGARKKCKRCCDRVEKLSESSLRKQRNNCCTSSFVKLRKLKGDLVVLTRRNEQSSKTRKKRVEKKSWTRKKKKNHRQSNKNYQYSDSRSNPFYTLPRPLNSHAGTHSAAPSLLYINVRVLDRWMDRQINAYCIR